MEFLFLNSSSCRIAVTVLAIYYSLLHYIAQSALIVNRFIFVLGIGLFICRTYHVHKSHVTECAKNLGNQMHHIESYMH